MNQANQLNEKNLKTTCKIFWSAMQASSPIFLVLVYFMNKISLLEPIVPEFKNILIGLCIVCVSAPFIFLGHFKRAQNKVMDNIKIGIDNETSDLQRYFSFLVIGMALCNSSAMFGLVLYITTGDYFYSLFFIAVSFLLGFMYKPELQR